MKQKKGLSQILYLIIAASVLMIAALSLVFMLNDGLSGLIEFGGEADAVSCERQVEQQCTSTGATSIETPSSCLTENAQGTVEVIGGVDQSKIGTETSTCSTTSDTDDGIGSPGMP